MSQGVRYLTQVMKVPPQWQAAPRPPRMYLAERTPAVLRLKDGSRVSGKLNVVSLTGGLLSVAGPVDPGCNAKLMFLTSAGMVLGATEMLKPLSWGLQPFRFVSLNWDDQHKLKTVIQQSVEQHRSDHGQIERSRAW